MRNMTEASGAVALVILNYNGRERVLECLRQTEAIRYPNLHVVVVDNGSQDGSAQSIRQLFPRVRLLENPTNLGVAGGRNAGIRAAHSELQIEYFMFVDNDTLVEPDAVTELIAAAAPDPRIGLVTPKAFRRKGDRRLLSAGGMHFNRYTGVLRDVAAGELDTGQRDQPRDVQACPGFAFLVRAEVFTRIGSFDESFNPYGWEDVDLSLRAGRAGYRIVYAPKAVVYHAGGRAGRGIVELYERHKARNLFTFVRRHTNRFQWLCFLALLPGRVLIRMARELLTGNGRVVVTWFNAWRRSKVHATPREVTR